MPYRYAGFLLFLALTTVAPAANAQQLAMTTVTLVGGDRGIVDSRVMATKDVVGYVSSQRGARTGMHIVTIQSCPGVPAATIQNMAKELEDRQFVIAIDLNDASWRLCTP
jgi:hypothetical protein